MKLQMNTIEDYTKIVKEALADQLFDNKPAELYKPISYILSLGGKRLRPVMTLAACELFGGRYEDALQPALGIEIFHNFTLLHDDIMDRASLRRGQPTVHEKWDTSAAILSGDAMLVKAYQYIAQVENAVLPEILNTFSQTSLEVCEGQQYDLNFEDTDEVEEDDYLEMIRLKTSVLLGAALKIGALIAKASPEDCDHIYRFGVNIGIAFQIQDDILDVFGDPELVGKQNAGDILNDKKTLLSLYARNHADDEQLALFKKSYYSSDQKIKTIRKLMEDLGSRDYATAKMQSFLGQALNELEAVNGNEEIKKELANFAEWLIQREQ